jgi:hypothetical protein
MSLAEVNPLGLRRAIGWGFVHFFLRLRDLEWEDLPLIVRMETWACAEDQR